MSGTQPKVAAATTVTALGALGAVAMASTQSAPGPPSAPAAAAPVEVRAAVIGKTVHRSKRSNRTKAEPGRAVSASAAAVAVPSTPPVAPAARPASSLDAAPALFAGGSTAATAQPVAYAAKRKPPKTSAVSRGYGIERREHREIGDD